MSGILDDDAAGTVWSPQTGVGTVAPGLAATIAVTIEAIPTDPSTLEPAKQAAGCCMSNLAPVPVGQR